MGIIKVSRKQPQEEEEEAEVSLQLFFCLKPFYECKSPDSVNSTESSIIIINSIASN